MSQEDELKDLTVIHFHVNKALTETRFSIIQNGSLCIKTQNTS